MPICQCPDGITKSTPFRPSRGLLLLLLLLRPHAVQWHAVSLGGSPLRSSHLPVPVVPTSGQGQELHLGRTM